MGLDSAVHGLNLTLGVFFLDLLLSGDNAIVIALACRSLPPAERRRAMLLGTAVAIVLRVVLTLLTGFVLQVPLLKAVGGVALVAIAIKLVAGEGAEDPAEPRDASGDAEAADFLSVIGTIALADLVMSLDNVIALAALANGSVAVLVLGLLLSVPLLMYGSWHLAAWLTRWPALVQVGGAMLGWFAGAVAVADPLYAGWITRQSPWLHAVVPALAAVYVLLQARIIRQARTAAAPLRPAPRSRPATIVTARAAAMVPARVGSASAAAPRVAAAERPSDHAKPPADALPAAPLARHESAAPRRWKRWAVGASGLVAALLVGALATGTMRTFVPADLARYDCPSKDVSLYYRPGNPRVRMANGSVTAAGHIDPRNRIDWGDYHDASTRLGFVPPTRMLFGDTQSVRIDGGMFADTTCLAH